MFPKLLIPIWFVPSFISGIYFIEEVLSTVNHPRQQLLFQQQVSKILCNFDAKTIYIYFEENNDFVNKIVHSSSENHQCNSPIFELIWYSFILCLIFLFIYSTQIIYKISDITKLGGY